MARSCGTRSLIQRHRVAQVAGLMRMVHAKAANGGDNGADDLDDPKKQVISTSLVIIVVHENCTLSCVRKIRDLSPLHQESLVVR